MDDLWLRLRATAWVVAVVCFGSMLLPGSVDGFGNTHGQDIAAAATAAQGASYVLGQPPRELGYTRNVQRAYDCSGLVWWAAATAVPDFQFPTRSQEQYLFGGNIAGNLKSADNWPVGSLIFLHDDNPSLGGGATHVSIWLGGGNAMDCLNEDFGCHIHNVTNDNYYNDHFLGATYPWGDTPSGTVTGTGDGATAGVGSGQIPALISQPGATYNEFASPVAGMGGVTRQPLADAATAVASQQPQAIVSTNMAGLGTVVSYAKVFDSFAPLHLDAAILLVLVVLVVKSALSVIRYVRAIFSL